MILRKGVSSRKRQRGIGESGTSKETTTQIGSALTKRMRGGGGDGQG
jgi:hypothetical protein